MHDKVRLGRLAIRGCRKIKTPTRREVFPKVVIKCSNATHGFSVVLAQTVARLELTNSINYGMDLRLVVMVVGLRLTCGDSQHDLVPHPTRDGWEISVHISLNHQSYRLFCPLPINRV